MRPYLRRLDDAWFIWWDYSDKYWYISAILGNKTPPVWSKSGPFAGTYFPTLPATGNATVTAGEH
ncbi:unnamed protein product [marine sediment metagenome]|uniref:Uncharacterized protein n=1 Tax=marine sediment metagenome TaxID=412755 RepID=X1L7L5_9ZZZZ